MGEKEEKRKRKKETRRNPQDYKLQSNRHSVTTYTSGFFFFLVCLHSETKGKLGDIKLNMSSVTFMIFSSKQDYCFCL